VNESERDRLTDDPVVGLVPAAGFATRLGDAYGSKELLPVWSPRAGRRAVARPAIHCLLSAFEEAAVSRTVIVFRRGKEDIPDTLGDATDRGMALEYLRVDDTPSPPFTLAAAFPVISGSTVVMGFPDLLFDAPGSVRRLLEEAAAMEADIVLGLFPHPRVRRADEVVTEDDGFVRVVQPGGRGVPGAWTWGLATWKPSFSRFLDRFVAGLGPTEPLRGELSVGDVITAAAAAGLSVRWVAVSDAPFLDIGTPEALAEAYLRLRDPGG